MFAILAGLTRGRSHGGLWQLVCAAGLGSLFLTCAQIRHRRQKYRERALELSLGQRTEELERERSRQFARNHILEMLATNQSLGTVLDHVALLIQYDMPGTHCAILLKKREGCHVGAAPGMPKEWLPAFTFPHAVPFEVWKQPCSFPAPGSDAAWKIFMGHLAEPGVPVLPSRIVSVPVGGDAMLGAILLMGSTGAPCDTGSGAVDSASRLAQLAIEHSRFYDDLHFQAHHDGLTGLPNRALFEDRLERAVDEATILEKKLAVFFIDIDRFKQINDTMSHRTGDLFLIEIAERMRRAVRPGDIVARIGGDEFNVLISNIGGAAEAEDMAGRILNAIRQPIVLDGRTITPSASVGVALFPDDGTEPEELQREADEAMYCAKSAGRDRVQTFGARNDTLDRVRLEHELRVSLREGYFAVHYQPKIGANGEFGGLEALARLNHPVHGAVPPIQFIPVAEESGLIVPLGAWVLDEVCRQVADWRRRGFGLVAVAVNVSSVQISRQDFASHVQKCLSRHGIPACAIELELTESLLIGGGEESQRQMRELRDLGIRLSIDDFGTGYSSLSYLHKLHVDAIKLDRSFVQSIDTDQAARRLVQAMIGVAQGLGLSVIAEGVETEAQRLVLVTDGCPMMQGYLFSRPLPPKELETFLRAHTSIPDDLQRIGPALLPEANSKLAA